MSEFDTKNPNFDQVVRDSFSRQPFMSFIGAKIEDLQPGSCSLSVERRAELTQQHGFFHGGLVGSLLDSAAGYAAFSLYPENSTVLTIDMKVNFLNPASGGELFAVANVVNVGTKIYHLKGDVYSLKDGKKTHCMTGVFTMMCLLGMSDAPNLGRVKEDA